MRSRKKPADTENDEFLVWVGQRYMRIGKKDLEHFSGERAKRGRIYPGAFSGLLKLR